MRNYKTLGIVGIGIYGATVYASYHAYKIYNMPAVSPLAHFPENQKNCSQVYSSIALEYDSKLDWDEFFMGLPSKRRFLAEKAKGDVLEISAGTGRNLEYYNPEKIKSLTITDSSSAMLQMALVKFRKFRQQFEKLDVKSVFKVAESECLAFKDNSFDSVIDTFGLCSHSDPVKALQEMSRVCKKDGTIYLLEHGRGSYDWLNVALDKLAENHSLSWGCYWNRDIDDILKKSGLQILHQNRYHFVDISHFKLQQVIGKGGFGMVRIVSKRDTKQKYALKYINKKKCIKKGAVRNIFRERLILEKCDHPFIINLQFAFQDDEHMFMVIDLALGGDLRYHLMRIGSLPEQTVRIYAAEISSALHYLHGQNIIHRYFWFDYSDLKPENLLLDDEGHIHVTDFNVAIMLDEKIPTSKSGTTAYMDKKTPVEKAIRDRNVVFPNPKDLQPEYYPIAESRFRTAFINGLLIKNVPDRLGCGPDGMNEIKEHPWMQQLDWAAVERKEIIPEFIPDPSQNNYDFGAALEELLYESSPLGSKPVKKRKQKNQIPPTLASLWEDDGQVPNTPSAKKEKTEKDLDYIELYFESYIKPQRLLDGKQKKPARSATAPQKLQYTNYTKKEKAPSFWESALRPSRASKASRAESKPEGTQSKLRTFQREYFSLSQNSVINNRYNQDQPAFKERFPENLPIISKTESNATISRQPKPGLDAMYHQEQMAFKTAYKAVRNHGSTSTLGKSTDDLNYSRSNSIDINENIPPIPDSLKYRDPAVRNLKPKELQKRGIPMSLSAPSPPPVEFHPYTFSPVQSHIQDEQYAQSATTPPKTLQRYDVLEMNMQGLHLDFPDRLEKSPTSASPPSEYSQRKIPRKPFQGNY
ncbi:hypothetical protein HDV01_007773 [Terramyces sp. JEL0728]|nr:hypothetical protein HDV01_007773 [Terramyces sp. JEL0728]